MTNNLEKLPWRAFVRNANPDGTPLISGTDAGVLCIMRGERGAYPMKTDITADGLNHREGVTRAQAAAMLAGSQFGWDSPAADPDRYDADGVLKPEELDPIQDAPPSPEPDLPKRVVFEMPGHDPYGRNWVADFPSEGVTVRALTREDVEARADAIAAFLAR